MNLNRPIALAASASLLALVVAACGGNSTSAEPEPPPPAQPAEPTEPPAPSPAPAEPTAPAEQPPAPAEPTEPPAPSPVPAVPAPPETETGTEAPPEPAPAEVTLAGSDVPTPTEVPGDAIAVVGAASIAKADFDRLVRQREQATQAQGGEFPAAGTAEYESLKNEFVNFLVQREQFRQQADAEGVAVADADVDKRLDELKQQFFEGDEKKYQEELKKNGVTEEEVKRDLADQLLTEELYTKVVASAAVSDDEVKTYYDEHLSDYELPEQRDVAHILVETKKEADELLKQLNDGADFEKLAKEKSTDTGSGANGGNLGKNPRESWVKEFGDALWALDTGALSAPVKSQFGWHLIKALGDIEPARQQTLDEVKETISAQLKSTRESDLAQSFIDQLTAKYEGKILYGTGYEPPAPVETDGSEAPAEEGGDAQP